MKKTKNNKELSKLAEKKIDLAKKSFDTGDSEKGDEFLGEAKKIYYKTKEKEKAAKMYEKFGQFTKAGEIWKELGKQSRVKTLEKKKVEEIKEIKKGKSEETFVRRTSLVLGILSFSLSIYLLTKSITGGVIGLENISTQGIVGGALFILAIVLFYFYVRRKKKF